MTDWEPVKRTGKPDPRNVDERTGTTRIVLHFPISASPPREWREFFESRHRGQEYPPPSIQESEIIVLPLDSEEDFDHLDRRERRSGYPDGERVLRDGSHRGATATECGPRGGRGAAAEARAGSLGSRDRRRVDRAGGEASGGQVHLVGPTRHLGAVALHSPSSGQRSPRGTGTAAGWFRPDDRSYWMSTSPAVRTGVTPLDDSVVGLVELEVHVRRARWAPERGCQKTFRNSPAASSSKYAPKLSRSLLLFGIDPVDDGRNCGVFLGALA